MHAGAVIFCWFCMVVGLQVVGTLPLFVLTLGLAAGFASGQRRRWLHLVRRSRWLLLVLAITFLLSTPGEALVPGFPATREGVLTAIEHLLRFVSVLAMVAWLLDGSGRNDLMAGMYALSQPLRGLGWPSERAVARLSLVFEYLDRDVAQNGWRALLASPPPADLRPIEIRISSLAWPDVLSCLVSTALLVLVLASPNL